MMLKFPPSDRNRKSQRKLRFESLEQRRVLSATPTNALQFLAWQENLGMTSGATAADGDINGDGSVSASDLELWESLYPLVPAAEPPSAEWLIDGTSGSDLFELRLDSNGGNENIQLLVGDVLIEERLFSTVTAITVNGGEGNDTLQLNYDFSGGFFATPVTFNGGGDAGLPGDSLELIGSSFETVEYSYDDPSLDPLNRFSGQIDLTLGGDSTTIQFTGIEPLNSGTAMDAIFNLPVGPDDATLTDNGDGTLTLEAPGFETTTFMKPTGSLTINGGVDDTLEFTNALTLTAALEIDLSGGQILMDGGSITTTLDQTYNDAVLLLADTILTSTTGNITFNNFVDAMDNGGAGSDHGLTVNTPMGDNVFNAEVGGDNQDDPPNTGFMDSDLDGLEYLITDDTGGTGGQTKFNVADPMVAVTTTLDQTYNDAVLLLADTILTSTTGNITFNNFVDAMDNGGAGSDHGLTVNTPMGDNVFNAEVGGDNQDDPPNTGFMDSDLDGLEYLITDDTGGTGGQTKFNVADPMVAVTTTLDQTYNDAVLLLADTILTSTTGNITFNNFVDAMDNGGAGSDHGLTVNTPMGDNVFNAEVGGDNQDDPPNTGFMDSDLDGLEYLITDDTGGTGGQTKFNVADPMVAVTTTLDQTYNDAVLLLADTILTSTTGNITFNNFVDAMDNGGAGSDHGLTVNTPMGDNVFNAEVGGDNQDDPPNTGFMDSDLDGLEYLITDDTGGTGGQTKFNVADPMVAVTTTLDQTYNDAVLLLADTILTSTTGNITFNNFVDAMDNGGAGSDHGLTVNTPMGDNVFNAEVGGDNQDDPPNTGFMDSDLDGLEYLITDDTGGTGGQTKFNVADPMVAVTTTLDQTYNDAVLLLADTILTSTTGNITFNNFVDAMDNGGAGSDHGLTVNTPMGDNVFNAEVGGDNQDDPPNTGFMDSDLDGLEYLITDDTGGTGGQTKFNVADPMVAVTTTLDQTYNDAVLLLADTILTSTTGNITFNNFVDAMDNGGAGSDHGLTVNTPMGDNVFNAEVGGDNQDDPPNTGFMDSDLDGLEYLITDDTGGTGGQTKFNVADPMVAVTTTLDQTYNDAVLLLADTILTSTTGNITFNNFVDAMDNGGAGSDHGLTVNTPMGDNVFNAEVGGDNQDDPPNTGFMDSDLDGLEYLITDDTGGTGGQTKFNVADPMVAVTTTLDQTYNDAVLLLADTILTSTTGNITFNNFVDAMDNGGAGSDHGLTVNTPMGDNVFNAEVGGDNQDDPPNTGFMDSDLDGLEYLITDDTGGTGGQTKFNVADPMVAVTTTLDQTYNDAVLLLADTILTSTTGNITFNNFVDAMDNGGAGSDHGLTVNTPMGDNVFNAEVGGDNQDDPPNTGFMDSDLDGLEYLITDDTGGTGGQTKFNVADPMVAVTTTLDQTYNDAVLLLADTILTSTTGNITFNNFVDAMDNGGAGSDHGLTVNTPMGDNVFNAEVGGDNQDDPPNTGFMDSDLDGLEYLITDDTGGTGGQTKFNVADPMVAVTTTLDQTYNDAVLLLADTILTSTTGNITFNNFVDAMDNGGAGSDHGLTVNTPMGDNVFNAEVGGDNQDDPPNTGFMDSDLDGLEYLITDDTGGTGGQTKFNVADPMVAVTTTLDQTYNDAVLLLADTILTSTTGNITFNNFVDAMDNGGAGSDHGLTVNTPMGDNVFNAEVGGDNQDDPPNTGFMDSDLDGLEYLITDDTGGTGGQTKFNVADPMVAVTTTLDQTYNDAVLLLADTILTSTTGNITFNNFVDAMDNGGAGSDHGLTVNTPMGDNVFNAEVGGDNQDDPPNTGFMDSDLDGLEYLITDDTGGTGGQTKFNVADPMVAVTTTLDQTYNDAVLLLADTILTSTTGNITFNNFVDAMDNGGAGSDHGLTVNTPMGDNVFNAEVGGDNQDDPPNTGFMDSDLDGLEYLITDDTGGTGGQTKFNVADPMVAVTTTLDQTYNDAVLLLADTILTSTTGNITFNNFVDAMDNGGAGSDHGLTVNTPMGDNVFNAEVGGDNQDDPPNTGFMDSDLDGLEYLITDDTGGTGGQTKFNVADPMVAVTTTLDQTYNDAVLLLADTILTSTTGNITFNNFVDAMDNGGAGSDHGLTVNTPMGDNVFNAEVGGDNQDDPPNTGFMDSDLDGLEYLITDDTGGTGGQTKFNVADPMVAVTTTLDQTYNDAVLLLADTILTSTTGNITFNNFVDAMDNGGAGSDHGLTVNTEETPVGMEIFLAEVGGDNQDDPPNTGFMDSDENGLEYLIVVTGSVNTAAPLLIDVPITTTGDIDITVNETNSASTDENLTIGDEARLDTDGDGGFDVVGNVFLKAGDDIEFENSITFDTVTILAEQEIVIEGDFGDQDDAGTTIDMSPNMCSEGYLIAGTGITIAGGNDDTDTIVLQAERLDTTGTVLVQGHPLLGGDGGGMDNFELYFMDGGLLSVGNMIIDGGGGLDNLEVDHSKDTSRRVAEIQYDTIYAPFTTIIDGSNSTFTQGYGTAFSVLEIEDFTLTAGSAPVGQPDHLRIRGAEQTVDPIADPDFLDLQQLIHVSSDASGQFQLSGWESNELVGSNVRDIITNAAGIPSLMQGGEGNDVFQQGSELDVIFSGPGAYSFNGQSYFFDYSYVAEGQVRFGDQVLGGNDTDFLFSDIDVFQDGVNLFGEVTFDTAGESDLIDGQFPGQVNHGAQVGVNDVVRNITGMLIDGGARKDVFTWLYAQFMPLDLNGNESAAINMLIDLAFNGNDIANSKVGLLVQVPGLTLDDLDIPMMAQPIVAAATFVEEEEGLTGVVQSTSLSSSTDGVQDAQKLDQQAAHIKVVDDIMFESDARNVRWRNGFSSIDNERVEALQRSSSSNQDVVFNSLADEKPWKWLRGI